MRVRRGISRQSIAGRSIARHGAAALYGLGVELRGRGYDLGLFPVHRTEDLAVISVGNLRAGGSGKTPLAMYLARHLEHRGVKTALLHRGYRGERERRGGLVSRGSGPLLSARESGDEAYVSASRLRGVWVWVGRDRAETSRAARRAGAQAVVLDDGFQHRALHRDLEILLVCPEDLHADTALLPAGPLRETSRAVGRADLLAGLEDDWGERPDGPELRLRYVAEGLFAADASVDPLGEGSLGKKGVFLVSGIARPERFFRLAKAEGLRVVGEKAYPDHHRFTARDASRIEALARDAGASFIVTTEKDCPRLVSRSLGFPVYALRIGVEIVSGAERLWSLVYDVCGDSLNLSG